MVGGLPAYREENAVTDEDEEEEEEESHPSTRREPLNSGLPAGGRNFAVVDYRGAANMA